MVIWTPRAQADLKAIHHYIATTKDAPMNAKKVASDIVQKVTEVLSLPQDLGKKIPELNRPDLREISVHSWRVLYQVQTQNTVILTLAHKREQLSADDILAVQ